MFCTPAFYVERKLSVSGMSEKNEKRAIFEEHPVWKALAVMAFPTILSQLITLVYNMTDTWFIGRTNNPYMVGSVVMVATIYLMVQTLSNIFGVGGGNLVVNLFGKRDEEEARKVASISLVMAAASALLFSLLCFALMRPLLLFLGASENTYRYAEQYMLIVVVIGAAPTVLSNTMSYMIRNIGYAKEASIGLTGGGLLNMALDPLFMFVLLPDGYQVVGAALATLLSNVCVMIYYISFYLRMRERTILELPRRIERIRRESMGLIFSVGIPSGLSLLFYDWSTIVLNRLAAAHSDEALAAMGIVLKIERLPLNIGIGICLGMAPLLAYNYASGNKKRMHAFFSSARIAGLVQALICVAMYFLFAAPIMNAFIKDTQTVQIGTQILRARCFATPLMFLSFHMVYLMQAVQKGRISLLLAFVRQIVLNIPVMIILDYFWGMDGMIWSQVLADTATVAFSYVVYYKVKRKL